MKIYLPKKRILHLLCAMLLLLSSYTALSKTPIHEKDFKEIIKKYTFVGDFRHRSTTRNISKDEVFWRYELSIPKVIFPIDYDPKHLDKEALKRDFPSTPGSGRAIEHINRGRRLFIEGKYKEAKETWLSNRARYGTTYDYHRRNDYFIGYAFLHEAMLKDDERERRVIMDNATTFLSYAFQIKKNIPDPALDRVAAKNIYNLASIYYRYNRFSSAYATAREGLELLMRTGQTLYRPQLRRMIAESFIQNRTYLEAIQELDIALRQDVDREQAAAIFARVGDIYFDLNNFELAEEAYAIANRIDRELQQVHPSYFVLRGESLFWLKRFSEAQKMFYYALNGIGHKNTVNLPDNLLSIASIRIADAWLAQGDYKALQKAKKNFKKADLKKEDSKRDWKIFLKAKKEYEKQARPYEKAKLAYFKHISEFTEFRKNRTADYARIRSACLELPEYRGNNVKHTRDILATLRQNKTLESFSENPELKVKAELKSAPLSKESIHIAWACEVASYAQHERTKDMLERVREFANAHPSSKFLHELTQPVREVQVIKLQEYLNNNDPYSAIDFFEKNRKNLFPKISDKLKRVLFTLYVDIGNSEKAVEFWNTYRDTDDSNDITALRKAVFLAETAHRTNSKKWLDADKKMALKLEKREWTWQDSIKSKLFIERIMSTNSKDMNLRWILHLGKKWTTKEKKNELIIVCELLYPILSQLWENSSKTGDMSAISEAKNESIVLIDRYLPLTLQFETNCGYSLLQFEVKILKDDPLLLAKRFISRDYLPVNRVTAQLYWELAESLDKKGDNQSAKRVWRYIVDKGDATIPEYRYAKKRLDTSKTEYENIWE